MDELADVLQFDPPLARAPSALAQELLRVAIDNPPSVRGWLLTCAKEQAGECECETPLPKWTKGTEPGASYPRPSAGRDCGRSRCSGASPFLVVHISRKNVGTGTLLTTALCCWLLDYNGLLHNSRGQKNSLGTEVCRNPFVEKPSLCPYYCCSLFIFPPLECTSSIIYTRKMVHGPDTYPPPCCKGLIYKRGLMLSSGVVCSCVSNGVGHMMICGVYSTAVGDPNLAL